jgi:hypothetical protein
MKSALAVLVAMPLLAGCLSQPLPSLEDDQPPLTPQDIVLQAFAAIPPITYDAAGGVSEWESFLSNYPKRDWALPQNVQAAQYLAGELTKVGYRSEILRFTAQLNGIPVPGDVLVVRSTLEGADPTRRFALVTHYDTIASTVQGAYDNGAGTIATLEICRELAKVKDRLQHTVDCLFFDAEERGLVASRAYAQWYNATPERGFNYELVFGYDMTGINWPGHAWNLYAMIGTDTRALGDLTDGFRDFLQLGLHQFLAAGPLPGADDGIRILTIHDRNSDEPMYHQPGDTLQFIYEYVGGRGNFEKGFGAVVTASYYTILGFDRFDPRALPTAQ